MVFKKKNTIDLLELGKTSSFPVRLEGMIHTAPYSKKSCIWFEWIYSTGSLKESGYTLGHGTGQDTPVTVKGTLGDLTVYPKRIMLYIAPSFEGRALVDKKEYNIREFCLAPDCTYYVFSEKFEYHLPPFRFFPFIPRRKSLWLLALSDKPLENNRPQQPLIPTRQGMTG